MEGFSEKDLAELHAAAMLAKFPNLQYHCEQKIATKTLKVSSAMEITAVGAHTGDDIMQRFGMRYLLQNYASFVSDKNGLWVLGIETFQAIVSRVGVPEFVAERAHPRMAVRRTTRFLSC